MYVPVPSLQVGDEIAIDGDNPDSSETMRVLAITQRYNIVRKDDSRDEVIWFQFDRRGLDGLNLVSRWQQSKCGPTAWVVNR